MITRVFSKFSEGSEKELRQLMRVSNSPRSDPDLMISEGRSLLCRGERLLDAFFSWSYSTEWDPLDLMSGLNTPSSLFIC